MKRFVLGLLVALACGSAHSACDYEYVGKIEHPSLAGSAGLRGVAVTDDHIVVVDDSSRIVSYAIPETLGQGTFTTLTMADAIGVRVMEEMFALTPSPHSLYLQPGVAVLYKGEERFSVIRFHRLNEPNIRPSISSTSELDLVVDGNLVRRFEYAPGEMADTLLLARSDGRVRVIDLRPAGFGGRTIGRDKSDLGLTTSQVRAVAGAGHVIYVGLTNPNGLSSIVVIDTRDSSNATIRGQLPASIADMQTVNDTHLVVTFREPSVALSFDLQADPLQPAVAENALPIDGPENILVDGNRLIFGLEVAELIDNELIMRSSIEGLPPTDTRPPYVGAFKDGRAYIPYHSVLSVNGTDERVGEVRIFQAAQAMVNGFEGDSTCGHE